jgi:Na+-translocating ferredoxin:NAD+ oxidoreductase RnfC subunit
MFKSYLERIKDAGVVGVGGAGFPTHVKINNEAEFVIANGAECEPLLRVDQQVMELYADKIVEGLRIIMKISNAKKGVICLKKKYHFAVDKLQEAINNSSSKNISLHLVGNYYPAGDEQQMVYEVTKRVVPLGGLPIDVGAIVSNVSTLVNIVDATNGMPVTDKFITITGEVGNPITVKVPIGTPVKELIELANLAYGRTINEAEYAIILGGPVMGKVEDDWNTPVTKTLGGVIVLPKNHDLIKRKTQSLEEDQKIAKSVCCQCNYCTLLCPRNSLGLGVEPHKVMRAVGYMHATAIRDTDTIFGCCDCGICTYYACTMGLSPNKMITAIKSGLSQKGIRPEKKIPFEVSDAREHKLVPVKRFISKLGLESYDKPAPINTETILVSEVRILLKQHIGAKAVPVKECGDYVQKGELIGAMEEGKLGANVHASISGIITKITQDYIEINAR